MSTFKSATFGMHPRCIVRCEGIDAVYHFVAIVGVGQSMYEIADYTSVNNLGTAVLLEGVLKQKNIQRMVVASSMSIYGEGLISGLERSYLHGR